MAADNTERNVQQQNDDMNNVVAQAMENLRNNMPEADKQAITAMANAAKDGDASVDKLNAENFQLSMLTLKRLQAQEQDEAYQKEMQALYKRLAEKSGVDLSEGADNSPERFKTALSALAGFSEDEIKKAAPQAFKDVQSQYMKFEDVRQSILATGIEPPSIELLDEMASKAQIAEAYHREFATRQVNYFSELSNSADGVNGGFSGIDAKKGRNIALTAVMTAATGGTNLLAKGAVFAAKEILANKKVQDVAKKAGKGFRGFLEKKGVNLKPFDSAWESLKTQGAKLAESKLGKGLLIGGTVAAVAAYAVVTSDIDMSAIADFDARKLFLNEDLLAEAASKTDGVRVTGPFQEVFDAGAETPSNAQYMAETPGATDANANNDPRSHSDYMKDTPGGSATTPLDNDATADIPVSDIQLETVTVEPGSSIYDSVKDRLTEKLGMAPSEQQVMAITADIVTEYGIEDPRQIQAGFEFSFDYKDFEYADSVSQQQVDTARYGINHAGANSLPSSDAAIKGDKPSLANLGSSLKDASQGFTETSAAAKEKLTHLSPSEHLKRKEEFGL